jgi:DNA-binding MarR family transcriptional regulator
VEFPLSTSVGYQIRMTHRLLQRFLRTRIEPHGVTLGMWYFLRALWHEDGLTQRELSQRIGTMEPTTLTAIQSMERRGLVRRERNSGDRRKINIYLTDEGRALKEVLLPEAIRVVETATAGFSKREEQMLLTLLEAIRSNVQAHLDPADEIEDS